MSKAKVVVRSGPISEVISFAVSVVVIALIIALVIATGAFIIVGAAAYYSYKGLKALTHKLKEKYHDYKEHRAERKRLKELHGHPQDKQEHKKEHHTASAKQEEERRAKLSVEICQQLDHLFPHRLKGNLSINTSLQRDLPLVLTDIDLTTAQAKPVSPDLIKTSELSTQLLDLSKMKSSDQLPSVVALSVFKNDGDIGLEEIKTAASSQPALK